MNASQRRAVGTILVWIGVLAWAPFLYLLAGKQNPSIFPYLAAHLIGVLSGAWFRNSADRLEGVDRARETHGSRRKRISRVMIYLGVLTMVVYLVLTRVMGRDLEIAPFLAVHLAGVLGGGALRASVELKRWLP